MEVDGRQLTGERILLAPGGRPRRSKVPGAELGINSDGFFELTERPERVTVVGGGYIAVEIAGILAALGSSVTVVWRGAVLLKEFDASLIEAAEDGLAHAGATLMPQATPTSLARAADGRRIDVRLSDGELIADQDAVIWAVGRDPITDFIAPEVGLRLQQDGSVWVDEWQQTSVPGVFAVGDVTGKATLTPVAIAAGRRFADRTWGGMADRKMSFDNIPTVVFGHPPLGHGRTDRGAGARAVWRCGEGVQRRLRAHVLRAHQGQAQDAHEAGHRGAGAARGGRASGRPRH